MKMDLNELMRIAKDQCDSVTRVFKRHAEETKDESSMKAYRTMAQGRLHGIIEAMINIYACELVHEDDAYWENVKVLRSYEEMTENAISETFAKWYTEYLNRF